MSEPLLQAVRNNLLDSAQEILEEGASVDYRDENGMTALMEATLNLNLDMMTLLLDTYHATIDLEDDRGQTALNHVYMEYVGNNQADLLPIIDCLLIHGAAPDHGDSAGGTLLQWAAFNGFIHIANLLLARGVNPNSAINDALEGGNPAMIALLQDAITLAHPEENSELDDVIAAFAFNQMNDEEDDGFETDVENEGNIATNVFS